MNALPSNLDGPQTSFQNLMQTLDTLGYQCNSKKMDYKRAICAISVDKTNEANRLNDIYIKFYPT